MLEQRNSELPAIHSCHRVKAYLKESIVDTQLPSTSTATEESQLSASITTNGSPVIFPTSGWSSGYMNILDNGFAIQRTFIYEYLVDHCSSSAPTNNFRSLKSGYTLFSSGHVRSIEMLVDSLFCYYKGAVLPSMKKDTVYTVLCAIKLSTRSIQCVKCTCPAGESQSCVYLSAILHALELSLIHI